MIEFICLFFPAILGVMFQEHLNKKTFKKEELVRKYLSFNLLANIFSLIFCLFYYRKIDMVIPFDEMFTLTFASNYLILATLISLIIAFISQVMKQKVDMNINIKRKNK